MKNLISFPILIFVNISTFFVPYAKSNFLEPSLDSKYKDYLDSSNSEILGIKVSEVLGDLEEQLLKNKNPILNFLISQNINNLNEITLDITSDIQYINEDTRLTLEIFRKDFFKRSVLESDTTTGNFIENFSLEDFDGGFNFLPIGEGFSNGVELFVQKKFSNNNLRVKFSLTTNTFN